MQSIYKVQRMGIGVRKQIQLVQVVTTQQPAGNWGTEVEGLKYGVWAEIRNPSGSRDYSNGQTQFQIRRYSGSGLGLTNTRTLTGR